MRKLVLTNSFRRDLAKFLRRHKNLINALEKTLTKLENDIDEPSLHTHKLHGGLKRSYSCNVNYEFRIVFSYDDIHVYLEAIGSHDEVY